MAGDSPLLHFHHILRNCGALNTKNLFINKISKKILRGCNFYEKNKK